jgi:ABC-type polysaccharide/polyol phosphate export permease
MEAIRNKSGADESHLSRRIWGAFAGRVKYLDLVSVLVKRELKVKYRGSVLGYLWSMLNPLLFMGIISVVFSFLMRGIENYNLYVLSGILFWNMVTVSLNLGTSAIVRNSSLLQKVKVPTWIFPVVPAGLGLTNFALSLIPYTLIYLFSGREMPNQIWLVPVLFILTIAFIGGLSIGLSVLNVFFRDVAHVLEPLLTLTFYATPVIYDRHASAIPERVRDLLLLNPFTHYIEAFRAVMFGGTYHVTLGELVLLTAMSSCSLILGLLIYKNGRRKIIFYL